MVDSGSVTLCLSSAPDFSSRMSATPFFTVMLKRGLNPMKEYWSSFCGPSKDSRRYTVSCRSWSCENISRGEGGNGIFLNFKVWASLTCSCEIACFEPKAIPHLICAPDAQEHTRVEYLRLFCTQMYPTSQPAKTMNELK